MAKRADRKPEMWDIFRHDETAPPPPVPPASSGKTSTLPNINRGSRDSIRQESTPKIPSKFEDSPSVDLRSRLRELEIQLLDMRAGIERRLSSVTEDFPNRLTKELRIIQERDSYLWKESTQKQFQLSEGLKYLQDSLRSTMEQVSNELANLRRKVDEVTIKHSSTAREIEYIAKMPRGAVGVPSPPDYTALIQSFREAVAEERHKREAMHGEHQAQIQELHGLLRNSYVENGKRLQEHHEQLMLTQNETKGQLINLEMTKEEKQRNDAEYMKIVYSNLQRRLEEEVTQRVSIEKEYKAWTDGKLNTFQKMMKNEERGMADREANVLKMMQEGLSALHEIVTRVKESGSAQVTKVHSVMSENIKDLAQALSSIKDNLYGRIEGIEFSLQEEGRYRIEQNTVALNHIQNIVDDSEKYRTYIENQVMSTENRLRAVIYEMQQEEVQKQEKLMNWQLNYEQKFEEEISKFKDTLDREVREWEIKHKDTKQHTEQTALKVVKVKEDLEVSVEQIKNSMNFEDGLIEQKVQNSLNSLSDKFDREVLQIKHYFEKNLAQNNAEHASNLLLRMEQIQKLLQDQMKASVSEESRLRKLEAENLEHLLKQYTENIYAKVTQDLTREISDLSERLHKTVLEEANFKGELTRIRLETASSIESLFASIDEVKDKVKSWAEGYTGKVIEDTKEEFKVLIDVERELLLKEIDKARGELKVKVEDLGHNLSVSVSEEAQAGKKIELELGKEKEQRGKEIQSIEKRLEDVMGLMQEAISQSSEAVKAVCRALVTKEAVERNQSHESIMKSLQARMAALEDLLKFYTSKSAEELRNEVTAVLVNERNSRNQAEMAANIALKDMKSAILENKEAVEVELCLQGVIDKVVQDNTIKIMTSQKDELETITKKWVSNFERDLEDTTISLQQEIADATAKIEENLGKLSAEMGTKIEVRAFVDSMIGLLEKQDTNEGIKESHTNIEVLFRNMKKIEEYVNTVKEETENTNQKNLEKMKNEINKEIENLDQREAENDDVGKQKIEFIIEKIGEIEKADHQKALNILMDQVSNIKQELFTKEEALANLESKYEELKSEHDNYTRGKDEKDNELQESLKILAESNTHIENSINNVQKELPEIIQRINEHEEKIKSISENNNSE